MKNLTGSFILTTFSTPKIHQNPQQQKFVHFPNWHSRSRGVAKIKFDLPMLHGKHFFFCFPCSVGTPKVSFATPLGRECDFFYFCRTSQAGSSEIMKMQFWNHCVGVTLQTTKIANRSKIDRYHANL